MLKCFYILIWIPVFKLCFCQRRMGLGNDSILGKKYLVYFVESPYSETGDDTWLCAGAIVSPTQILTAAACLVEVNRIYAIAGHVKYVRGKDISKDKCANTWKKKVVKISIPKEYTKSTAKQIEWMNVDIGVATVQEPYNFNDQSYLTHCSYIPESIKINFDKNNEKQNTRAVALGWGGKKIKSEKTEAEKVKPKLLQEATTTIIDKTYCAKLKNGSKELVDKYMLCASGNGFLGEDDDESSNSTVDEQPSTLVLTTDTENINDSQEMSSRKSSLLETCQNDHGGPLVTWVAEEEVILGVALNGICNPNFDCVGPRIYVSTAATAKIIDCLLETDDKRRKTCNDQVDDQRYQVYDIDIEWPEDLKTNSSLRQQSSLFRRQVNEEETLHVRPTKDLRAFDEQETPEEDSPYNPLDNPQENQQNNPYQLEESQRKNRQQIPQENQGQNTYDEQKQSSQADQTQGIVNDERNNQPRKPHVGHKSQQLMESPNQPQVDSFNQQMESQNQPQINNFNQAPMDSYNQPPLDSYYNQPPVDPYYNQPMDSNYKQPAVDSSYNQSPIKSKHPPEIESYNQPQTGSYNQPIDKSKNQKPMDPYNQLQMDLSNQPHMASQNQPHRQINSDKSINNNPHGSTFKPPQMESYMPSQEDPYNQPQIGSYKNPLRDLLKLSPFKKTPAEIFYEPQAETFNKTELGSFRPPPSKVESVRLARYSNKQSQSAHNSKQMESPNPVTAGSYNPLDIIMAENEPEEDEQIKPLMEDPYKPPPVEQQKQLNDNPYMPQPAKPAQGNPLLSKKTQHSTRQEESLRPPFEEPQAPQFDSSRAHSALREGPRNPALEHPQDESQTFEKMFSQLHAEPEAPEPPPPSKEETFDELFRNLHDGDEEPRDKNDETRTEQPTEQEAEQDGVKLRQQMPLEYPDYSVKSKT